MLTDVVLACDGKKPAKVTFEQLFDYHGKKKLSTLKSLSAKADTNAMSLAYLGDIFPKLQILRLNHSIIPSIRDLSAQLHTLRVLSLEHCGLTLLDGITSVSPKVQELYLGFNKIDNISELLGLNFLKILNLEGNLIANCDDVGILKCCRKLRRLVLRGNGAEENPEYRNEIKRLIPKLRWLDDVKYGDEEEEKPEPPQPPQEPAVPDLKPVPRSAVAVRRHLPDLPHVPDEEALKAFRPGTRQKPQVVRPKRVIVPVKRPPIWHNVGPIRL